MTASAKDDKRCSSAIVLVTVDGPLVPIILEAWVSDIGSYR
jgi:hypothetical protein